jgi:hypothetical protein
MKPLSIALLAGALWGCNEPTPCDDVPGTCLNVNLQSAAAAGERIDGARFTTTGDGALRDVRAITATAGGQLLPLTVGLPLPDAAQRTICVHAEATRGADPPLNGTRTVADLVPGDHRLIWIALSEGAGGGCQ